MSLYINRLILLAACGLWLLSTGSGLAENPGKYFVEYISLPDAPKLANPLPDGDLPDQGVPFIEPESGHRITRISDVNEMENVDMRYPLDGYPHRGATNGYSKYTNVNITGEYASAWITQGYRNALYHLPDCTYVKFMESEYSWLGETHDVRWDLSGRPGTEYDIIYQVGSKLCRQNAIIGKSSEEVIYDFDVNLKSEDHMSQDTNGRYRAVGLADSTTKVIDMIEKKLLPVTLHAGGKDISPTGRWLYLSGTTPVRFYDIQALAQGDTTQYSELPTTNHGHDGWAFDKDGNEVYVFQDNKSDWFSAFNPATNERINIFGMWETGWHFNQHLGRILSTDIKGWLLISSYCSSNSTWAYNQLMMIEIKPSTEHPRIWHLTGTHNTRWKDGQDIGGYFSEAFASISPDGNSVYWGANWMAKDNLELYRVELPENWHQYMDQHDNNMAPLITDPGDQVTPAGVTLNFTINGNDSDGDALAMTAVNLPEGASVTPQVPTTFTWTPSDSDHGDHLVTFCLTDGIYTSSKTVRITVKDTSPPSPPSGLAAEAKSDSEIELNWLAGTDPDSDVVSYNIYQDGQLVGNSQLLSFLVSGLNERTTYSFMIRSVNGAGLESTNSNSAQATTPNNTIPPSIVSIETFGNNRKLEIVFDEDLDPNSAQNAANYIVEPSVTVEKAILQEDGRSVILQTTPHVYGQTYKVTVVGIKDMAFVPNVTGDGVWRHYVIRNLAPSNYLIEHVESTVANKTSKVIMALPTWSPPDQGVPFILSQPGHRVTRISDVNQLQGTRTPYTGEPNRGLTNGYSKYTGVNVTGEYVIAWATSGGNNLLYRLSDLESLGVVASSNAWLGETNDVRWNLSGQPGTEYNIIYNSGSRLLTQNVLEGPSSEELIYDFEVSLNHEGHMDQDTQARYRAMRLSNGTTRVIDMREKRLLPPVLKGGGTDISPMGKWLYLSATTPVRFYNIEALAMGDTSKYSELPTTSHGHDGWAFDKDGNEVYVFQDNNSDWFSAFNPATSERINIIHMSETGWRLNQHLGRVMNPLKKGWMLMSSYCSSEASWAYNQLLMIEIKPASESPRIWRLGTTFNHRWVDGVDVGGYFSEAFASIDKAGNNIYWGSNWIGQSNLELYRMELPQNWHEVLAAGTPLNTASVAFDWTRLQ